MRSYYTFTEQHLGRFEPTLVRLTRHKVEFVPPLIVRFTAVPSRLHVVRAAVYGVNGTPRARMRHQVQLGEGAPGWRGQMPTDRYEVIR